MGLIVNGSIVFIDTQTKSPVDKMPFGQIARVEKKRSSENINKICNQYLNNWNNEGFLIFWQITQAEQASAKAYHNK